MQVSFYKNSNDTTGVEVDHIAILGGIKAGRWSESIENLRALLQAGSEDDYARSKKLLPAVTFGGTFSRREAEALTEYSSMIVLDVDGLSPEQVQQYKSAFTPESDRFIHACFISPSGGGIKILVKLKCKAEDHIKAFLALEHQFKEAYAIKLDKSGKDICRLCYVSHDPDLYLNEDSDPFEFIPEQFEVHTTNSFDKRPEKFKGHVVSKDAKKVFQICEKWTQRHHEYVSGNRNNYIHVLACNMNRAGVFVDDTLMMIYNAYSDLDFKEIEQTVNSAYKNKGEHNSIDVYEMAVDDLPQHTEATETMTQQEETIYLDTYAFLAAGLKTNIISKYLKHYGTTFLELTDDNVKALMNQAFSDHKEQRIGEFSLESADRTLMNVLENYKDNGGVPTGIAEIDSCLGGGLMPGNLYGFVGDGGTYKSIIAQCIGSDEATIKKSNNLVIYLNGEMSELQLMDRTMNKELGVELQAGLRDKSINKDNIGELAKRLKEVYGDNFQIVSSSGWNKAEIAEIVKGIEAKTGKKVTLIIVDGISQMEDKKNDEIKSAIHNSGQLKELAKETNAAIIALVHVSGNPPKHHRDTSKLIRGGTKLINNMDAMICTSLFIDEESSNFETMDIMYRAGLCYVRFIDKRGSGMIINKAIKIHRPLKIEVLAIDPHQMEVSLKS